MTQELPLHAQEALGQRYLYQSRKDFLAAKKFVRELLGIDAGKTLDDKVYEFLRQRKIKPDETPERLSKRLEEDVRLLGATFYFARKFFTTSHDILDGINPTPLIENVFEVLQASDNKHATKFLEEIAGVSSKLPYQQEQVVRVVRDVLPILASDYKAALSAIETRHPKGTTQYNAEKLQFDTKQISLLDKVVPYISEVVITHQIPSTKGFKKYAGLEIAKSNGEKVSITIEYITKVLKEEQGKLEKEKKRNCYTPEDLYKGVIARIEKEVDRLVVVSGHRDKDGDGIKLSVGVGDVRNPKPHQFTYKREKRSDGDVYGLLLSICDHIRAQKTLPTELKTTTALARTSIVSYYTRG